MRALKRSLMNPDELGRTFPCFVPLTDPLSWQHIVNVEVYDGLLDLLRTHAFFVKGMGLVIKAEVS